MLPLHSTPYAGPHWRAHPVQIRWVFGDLARVRVTSTLHINSRGVVVAQTDRVDNWMWVPLPLRLLLGLAVPAVLTVARPL